MAVSFSRSKYLLFTNLSITYCPVANTRTIIVKSAISESDDLIPPDDVAIPTIELLK